MSDKSGKGPDGRSVLVLGVAFVVVDILLGMMGGT